MFFLQLHVFKTNISDEHWTQSNLNSFFFVYKHAFIVYFFKNCHFLYSHSDQLPSFICIFSYSQGVLSESVFLTFLIFIPYFLPISTLTIVDQTPIISYLDHCPGLVIPQSFPNCSMSYCQIIFSKLCSDCIILLFKNLQ